MQTVDCPTGNSDLSAIDLPKRERNSVPFSPRHEENNKMSSGQSNRKRSFPMATRNSSNPLSFLSPARTGVDMSGRHRKKRTLDLYSAKEHTDDAKKRIKRFEIATNNIADMQQQKQAGDSSGIIKSIKMYNFMCHKSFEQKWHKNINFVIGENGSGKSALLSALMIGLGGKALSTSRTSSVKDLIKTGETHAMTVIVLLNQGKLPIEKYGKEISVQRTIDLKGRSSYKIQYGVDAKNKPATKDELDNLLRLLDIQLENPVVILNQEYARSFLRSKDPKDKYKLFEDGTGTADCDRMQAQVKETLKEIEIALNKKKMEVDGLRKSKEELEEKIKLIEGISGCQAKLHELDTELAWHRVEEREKREHVLAKDLERITKKLEESEGLYQVGLKRRTELESESAAPKDRRNEQLALKSDYERRGSAIQKEINNVEHERVRHEMAAKSAKALLPRKESHLKRVEEKIQAYEEKAKGDRDKEMNKYLEAKAELEEQISENERTIRTLRDERDRFSTGAQALRKEIEDVKRDRESVKNQIADKDRQLKQMEKSSSAYTVFGNQMITLMEKINQAKTRFSQRPRGPLGACITVKNAEYVDIIQHVLGNKLADFVVDNNRDSKVLNELIEQVYGKRNIPGIVRPSVTVLKFAAEYDCSQRNASRGIKYPTILDMLEFDNNDYIIKNTLLDIASIERFLLFKTSIEALDLLTYREKVPRTCMGGYSLDFYHIKPDPNLRITPFTVRNRQTKLIKSSRVSQRRNLQLEIETLREELQNLVVSTELIEEERKLRNEEKKREEEYREKRGLLGILKQRHSSLREPPNRVADLASMVEERDEGIAEIAKLREEIDRNTKIADERKVSISELKGKKKDLNDRIDQIDKELVRALENQEKFRERADKLEAYVLRLQKGVDKAKEDVAVVAREVAAVKAKLAEETAVASDLGERVSHPRNSADIKAEHDSIKAKIEHLEKFKVRHGAIKERYKTIRERYNKYESDLTFVCEMYDKVDKYFKTVCLRYLWARDRCVKALKKCYEEIANARKYHGKLLIDVEERELFYLICPDKESLDKISKHEKNRAKYKSKMIEYAAGLSGGERSFSTICFIIAMWQAMKTPFYMLDEFDVFMDAQNRTVSQEALINHAKAHRNNQFFFFTPLDLTNIPSSDDATVLRLFPPERGQMETSALDLPDDLPSTSQSRKRGGRSNDARPSKAPRL